MTEAPNTSHDAARWLSGWRERHDALVIHWRTARDAADDAEAIYRRAQAKALLFADGRSQDVREAQVDQHEVDGHEQASATAVSRLVGIEATPDTVGDLRWLRDRMRSMADVAKQQVRDSADEMDAWRGVLGMARDEIGLARSPERQGVA